MYLKNSIILSFFILFIGEFVYCQGKTSIAVLELDAQGISKSDASIITDRLRAELFNTNKYTVLERDKMNEVLNEQGFQLSGCTTDECIVEVGKLIGVRQIIAGKIGKIGNLYTIIVRIIEVETGKVIKVATDDCDCPIEQVLTNSVKKIAYNLTSQNYKEYKKVTEGKYKNPFIAGVTGFALPIAGHAYVGGTNNLIRGAIYTGGGYTLIILGIAWNLSDDGLLPFLLGIGVNIISSIDAGISAKNYNKKLQYEGFSFNIKPRLENKGMQLTLSYNF